ncbi:Reticulon [Cordyceps fumosorosea ARSEF 2679]|uniref:Reticulon-like protein n=1 Tax=Cordyceps fumosorosea (strain ARSEF 2679) TaxID=1081104 RepID=A0A167UB52_CORFA|nr:Reticulon [Cordyceps fumosorosea ARSEF 2679]OAA61404.1 Reticulon [Cordyceps fumosorosea ARSEF 2679]
MADIADATPAANGASPFEKTNASVAPKPAVNGRKSLGADAQPMTHYHSLFTDLLSWKNPRNSAIAYGSIVTFILATRYFDILRWAIKLSWMTLAVTITAEAAGKLVLNSGIASQLRPRRYHTIHRDTIDGVVSDAHELANFFIIEAQRILFVENIGVSAAACVAAFISYFLVKLVPYWGLAILGTTLAFFVPLVYAANKELIDEHLQTASEAINAQTAQVREAAQKQADQLTALGKQYAGDYTGKVQDMIRGRPAPTAAPVAPEKTPAKAKAPEFPTAPTEEPIAPAKEAASEIPEMPAVPEQEPLIAA